MRGQVAGLLLGVGLAITVLQLLVTLAFWVQWQRAARRVR